MSAEDELPPRQADARTLPDFTRDVLLAEFWDDSETDEQNLRVIGWWLSRTPDPRAGSPC